MEILVALKWPIVVLVSSVIFLVIFKKDISSLIGRINETKWPGGGLLFSMDKSVGKLPEKIQPVDEQKVKFENSGNLFWAAHDLMWTKIVLMRGEPREQIVHGLKQSLHHIRGLGLNNTPIESRLIKLKNGADESLQSSWNIPLRQEYLNEIDGILGYLGKLASDNQPDYKTGSKET